MRPSVDIAAMRPDAWSDLVRSVERRRSYDALFFKPVCLIAAIDGVTEDELQPSDLDGAVLNLCVLIRAEQG